MQPIYYCKGWFRAKKCSLEPFTDTTAKSLHESGELYCALIGDPAAPVCFLEITKEFVGVGFLDKHLRENLSYSFQEREPGRVFLSMATWREFDGESNAVAKGTTYVFQPNGDIVIQEESFQPQHSLAQSSRVMDVSANWDSFPRFGEYSPLIRVERLPW